MENDLVLEGYSIRIEPLALRHLPALIALGKDPDLWQYTFQSNPFTTHPDAEAWLASAQSASDARAFAIVDLESGEVAGSTRYLDISDEHRKLEIGWTFLGKRFWRTHANTAAKYLLFRYAFEEWNAVRVQLKAEAINQRSRTAILRLGAVHEGTLRNFRIRPDGELRDVSFYSVTRREWPQVKARLLSRLDRTLDSRAAV